MGMAHKTVHVSGEKNLDGGEIKQRKPHRFRPGTQALRQIRRIQKGCETLIPKANISRLIREIAGDFKSDIRFTANAMKALHEASEPFLIERFADAQLQAIHAGRITITDKDLKMVARMKDPAR